MFLSSFSINLPSMLSSYWLLYPPVIFIQYTVCGKGERIVRWASLAPLGTFPEDDWTRVSCLTGFFPWCSIFTWKSFGVFWSLFTWWNKSNWRLNGYFNSEYNFIFLRNFWYSLGSKYASKIKKLYMLHIVVLCYSHQSCVFISAEKYC